VPAQITDSTMYSPEILLDNTSAQQFHLAINNIDTERNIYPIRKNTVKRERSSSATNSQKEAYSHI